MKTVEIKSAITFEFIEIPCKCGCGKIIQVKLPKFFSTKCYAKSLEKKK